MSESEPQTPAPTPAGMPTAPAPSRAPTPLETETRRGFLAAASCALAACAGAATLGPALLAVISPASGGIVKIGEGTVDLGAVERFEEGVPTKVTIHGARTDAYLKLPERALGAVLVVRRGGNAFVYAAACPHLGCEVTPREKEKDFFCACHDSRFTLEGAVTAGPSPRGLDSLAATVEGGHVHVRFERFQVGIADKRAV